MDIGWRVRTGRKPPDLGVWILLSMGRKGIDMGTWIVVNIPDELVMRKDFAKGVPYGRGLGDTLEVTMSDSPIVMRNGKVNTNCNMPPKRRRRCGANLACMFP